MRKLPASLLILTLIFLGIGYVLKNTYKIGILCNSDATKKIYDISCHDYWSGIGEPLFYGMAALATVFLVLLLFPHAFKAWQNFALWFLPLAIDTFVSYKGPGGGFMDPLPDSVTVYRWVDFLYVLISLAIIAASVFRERRGKSRSSKDQSKNRKIIFWSLWALYVAIIIGAHFFN
jgi:hypothetical protein